MINEKVKVYRIIEIINSDRTFNKFEYKNEFISKWKNYIENVDSKVRYSLLDESDKDQAFIFTMPIENYEMDFCFSIKYIRDFYLAHPNYKQEIILENHNGKLYNGENECCYTLVNETYIKKDYKDDTEAFIIPFPQGKYNFLVIDGNHRINLKINRNDKEIKALYVDYELATRSLTMPLQICSYCLLEDYSKIIYNLKRHDHKLLLRSSNIFKKNSRLNIIENERKR